MKYLINIIRLILIVIVAAYGSTIGLIILLFTGSTDKCINTAVYLFSNGVMFVCGTKFEKYGNQVIEKSPGKIYISNHESHMDPPAVSLACPHPLYYIAKKEIKYVPFIGWDIWLTGMIFIDRKNKMKSQESIKIAGEKVKSGKNVISFAEGTRSKTGELMPFKKGAFRMAKTHGLDIVPIGILGSRDIMAAGSLKIHSGKTLKVNIGEVIKADDHANLTLDELSKLTREKVKELIEELKKK